MAFKHAHRQPRISTGSPVMAFMAVLMAAIGTAPMTTLAQPVDASSDTSSDTSSDIPGQAWQESMPPFPAMPEDANLIPFTDTAASRQRFAIDAKSLKLGEDGVVRYTLVGISPSGVRNISYEAIRCQTYERKIYASGRSDGSWSPARNSQWMPILELGMNQQQASLAQDYFCNNTTVAGNASSMLTRLRRQATLTEELLR